MLKGERRKDTHFYCMRCGLALCTIPCFQQLSILLKIGNLSCLTHLQNNAKSSCYLANIPTDFRSYACHFSECWSPSFSSCLLPLQLPNLPPAYWIGTLSPSVVFVHLFYLTLIRCTLLLFFYCIGNVFNKKFIYASWQKGWSSNWPMTCFTSPFCFKDHRAQ